MSYICKKVRSTNNKESGFSLIEILVALGILAAVAVVFLLGMTTSSKAVMVSQEAVAVDSLAKSQMEYVKNLPYDSTNNPPVYGVDPNLTIPQGYQILPSTVRLDPENDGLGDDDGVQQITVTITRNGQTTSTLVDYKVNR
ncbi:MAG: type II secretion system GspH family protein [Dehalococcoidia bacterium]|nr:type II secretion system GspH family protein [Dehalococcoidia bacterium]